jgi:hypothetical protein
MKRLLKAFVSLVLLALCASNLSATTWYIKPDGTGDAPTIQAGIDSAAIGDTIMLANGTYTGPGNRDISVPRLLTLRSQSGTPDSCVIDCEGLGRGLNLGNLEILEGVKITNGFAEQGGGVYMQLVSPTISNCIFSNCEAVDGGGMHIAWDSNPVITDCTFIGNSASKSGGGIYWAPYCRPSLTNCTIADNTNDGIYSASSGAVLMRCKLLDNIRYGIVLGGGFDPIDINDCIFAGNTGHGMGIYGVTGTITGCRFVGNGGNAMIGAASITVIDCSFIENDGAIEIDGIGPNFEDCLFWNNAHGVVFYVGSSTFRRCTLVANGGYAMRCYHSSLIFENCVVAFNNGSYYEDIYPSDPTFICCDIFGNFLGDWVGPIAPQEFINGNFSADPFFCDPDSGDFTLLVSSPCLPINNPACGLVGALGQGCYGVYTPIGTNVVVNPPDSATGAAPVTLTFDSVTVSGITTLEITDQGPPPDAGFKLCGSYYEISTTAVYTDSITICFYYGGTSCANKKKPPLLRHYENGSWVPMDTTHWDSSNNIICGAVESFSIFALFESDTSPFAFNIHPRSCPNPFNIKWLETINDGRGNDNAKPNKGGVMPAAIVGSENFDVTEIDVSTLLLEGVAPLRSSLEDVTVPVSSSEACPCTTGGPDGFMDLTLKFSRQEIAAAISPAEVENVVELTLVGSLMDGTPFEVSDCVTIVGSRDDLPSLASGDEAVLKPAVPNPFNPVTRISYYLPREEFVKLNVYDVTGKLVDRLVSDMQKSGEHIIEWNASGRASGIYFYRIEVGDFVQTRKLILLK